MLSSAEIAEMRTIAEATFDSTAIIQSRIYASDGAGGGTTTWTPAGTVACHLSPVTSRGEREPVIGERITPSAEWVLTLPAETEITADSRVVVSGETFEVLRVSGPRTWELTRRVDLAEVR